MKILQYNFILLSSPYDMHIAKKWDSPNVKIYLCRIHPDADIKATANLQNILLNFISTNSECEFT